MLPGDEEVTDDEIRKLAEAIGKEVYRAHEKIVLTVMLSTIYAGLFLFGVLLFIRLAKWIVKK